MLSREDYYRPTHARDLRRKADRIDWWNRRLSFVALLAWSCFLTWWGIIYLTWGYWGFYNPDMVWWAMKLLGLTCLKGFLPMRAIRLRLQAEGLEQEHEARYLPRSSAPDPEHPGQEHETGPLTGRLQA